MGEWRTALLLGGNIGIGGHPVTLLRRVAALIAADGRVLVELGAPGCDTQRQRVRLEVRTPRDRGSSGPAWPPTGSTRLVAKAGLGVHELWQGAGRWFTELARVSADGAEPPRAKSRGWTANFDRDAESATAARPRMTV